MWPVNVRDFLRPWVDPAVNAHNDVHALREFVGLTIVHCRSERIRRWSGTVVAFLWLRATPCYLG